MSLSRGVAAAVIVIVATTLSYRSIYYDVRIDFPHTQSHNRIGEPRPSQNDPIPLTFSQLWREARQIEVVSNPPPERFWLRNATAAIGVEDSDKNNTLSTTITIPKVINKIFIQKTGGFIRNITETQQTAFANAHESWHIKNPGYTIHYYDLDRCRLYLHRYFHQGFLRAFDCLQAFAHKVDFFRIALLYREGGWYSDWKEVALIDNLLDKLAADIDFFAVKDKIKGAGCIQNAFIGAIPRYPILAEMLKRMLIHVQSSYYSEGNLAFLEITGPCLLGKVYDDMTSSNETLKSRIKLGQSHEGGGVLSKFNGETLVQHKCDGCGGGQSWSDGNNYIDLHKKRELFCQDSGSIFNMHQQEHEMPL